MKTKSISARTTIYDLIDAYPFILEFLADYSPKFGVLRNPALRATMGRVASLDKVASIGAVSVNQLIKDVADRIADETGEKPDVDLAAGAGDIDPDNTEKLKHIIRQLHDGENVEQARAEFKRIIADVEPRDIAAMEQDLILEGMPVEEIHRLCDLHVDVFRDELDMHEEVNVAPGHPLHTYMAENREIIKAADRWAELCRASHASGEIPTEITTALDQLAQVEIHYTRKENQLFPYLEKHEFTGPSQVMWGLHDDVRGLLKKLRQIIVDGDTEALREYGLEVARIISEMVYKEEKILFPTAQSMLDADEWNAIREGDDEIGYAFIDTPPPWSAPKDSDVAEKAPQAAGMIELNTGALSQLQLDEMLLTMPFECSFVDENDEVRYYSGHPERVFPRSPAVIGRKVQNCHPPHSVHMVNSILEAFKAGTKDKAEFWLTINDRFIYVSYYPVRDENGHYLGCLEVTQDVTRIRKLEGEQRLLDWDS